MADIYSTDYMNFFPPALKQDKKMIALATALSKELMVSSNLINIVLIYARIDELPENVLDILAYDMHVDWYEYDYPIEAKRRILKSSVKVHKRLGTKYAVETALGGLHPNSEIEEWFEYNGQPHYFRIVLDVTNSLVMADYFAIMKSVKMYKRLSSYVEDLIYQCSIHGKITSHTDYWIFKTPATGKLNAGTYPQRNTQGGQTSGGNTITTEKDSFNFITPQAGTKPDRSIIFDSQTAQIDAESTMNSFGYVSIPTGKVNAGETPQRNTSGANRVDSMGNAVIAEAYSFNTKLCGTTKL